MYVKELLKATELYNFLNDVVEVLAIMIKNLNLDIALKY